MISKCNRQFHRIIDYPNKPIVSRGISHARLLAKWFNLPKFQHTSGNRNNPCLQSIYQKVPDINPGLAKVVISIRANRVNLRYLIPYLRSRICFGILRIFQCWQHCRYHKNEFHSKVNNIQFFNEGNGVSP